jgi:lipid A 3-O-deacylase
MDSLHLAEAAQIARMSHPGERGPARILAGLRRDSIRRSAWFDHLAISLLLVVLTAPAVLGQPAAQEPECVFESIPPAPFVWGMPVESVPDEVDPFSPVDCFAEAFHRFHGSLQVLGGAYFCPIGLGPHSTPRYDIAPIDVRLGCMLFSPFPDDCCLRGNIEALLALTTAPVFDGFGSLVIGPTVLLRYNLVQPDWRLVPYLQGGGGFTYNDSYRDKTQRALGQAGEFYLQATAGVHYLLSPHCSLDLEGGYIHISNADTNARNGGINSFGGSIGMTYFFGKHQE